MARALLDCLVSWHVFIISLLPQASSHLQCLDLYAKEQSGRQRLWGMHQTSAAGKLVTS